ncbi:DUF4145 domain-containing protein [Micromonospora sp. WMMD723]|uniref:DUF4145 domain-containing protein n=1 Tax=Micromonospora sp. WMMD723 TaxID=3403465 RepID=UPI003CF05369
MVDETTRTHVSTCGVCDQGTIVVEKGLWSRHDARPNFKSEGPVFWWPTPNAAERIDPTAGVPDKARDAYGEGIRCLAVRAPNAAAGRFRSALAVLADDKGGEVVKAERTLSGKLKRLYEINPLLVALGEHADTIKIIGDAGTHQEEWPSLSQEQAELSGQLVRHLIEALYEFPARMLRSRPVRPPR